MRTQSPDTSLAAECYLIERIRQAPVSKHFHLFQSLSERILSGYDPTQDSRAEAIHVILDARPDQIRTLAKILAQN